MTGGHDLDLTFAILSPTDQLISLGNFIHRCCSVVEVVPLFEFDISNSAFHRTNYGKKNL
jgi:hypothetical protein